MDGEALIRRIEEELVISLESWQQEFGAIKCPSRRFLFEIAKGRLSEQDIFPNEAELAEAFQRAVFNTFILEGVSRAADVEMEGVEPEDAPFRGGAVSLTPPGGDFFREVMRARGPVALAQDARAKQTVEAVERAASAATEQAEAAKRSADLAQAAADKFPWLPAISLFISFLAVLFAALAWFYPR